MNKKILSIVLTGTMVIGGVSMAYADNESKNDIYAENKGLQEIFKIYDDADKTSEMLLAPNPMVKEDTEIRISKDGAIEVKLEENISTGCTWHIEIQNEDLVKVDVDEYKDIEESKVENEVICGANGVHIWNIKALKEGTTKIIFKLYQDWEPESVYDVKKYTIVIGEDGEDQAYVNPYMDNKELQEVFEIYDNADADSDLLLLSPYSTDEKSMEKEGSLDSDMKDVNRDEDNLLQKLIQYILDVLSI